jgi:ABC-type branched-subunit amino acid transport system ATPase component
MLESVLRADGLRVVFGGVVALDDVSIDVRGGEVVGVIGPNGAGKTTLLDALCGFVATAAGSVWFAGRDVTRLLPYQRARLGLIRSFQDARLYPTMTVRDVLLSGFHTRHSAGILAEGLRLRAARAEAEKVAAAAEALLDVVDLRRYLDHRVSQLSLGTTRAVELAWLAARGPRLLLLDEPASGLQQSEVAVLGGLIQRIRGDAAVVVIDHDVPFVCGLAERLVAMHLGRVVAEGAADDVLDAPDVVESYLGVAR